MDNGFLLPIKWGKQVVDWVMTPQMKDMLPVLESLDPVQLQYNRVSPQERRYWMLSSWWRVLWQSLY